MDLNTLAAVNNIANINLIDVGQVLTIPGQDRTQAVAISRPGETLDEIAVRLNLSATQLAVINSLTAETRLFPGQPILLPAAVTIPELPFGAIEAIDHPLQLIQGRTGWLDVESSHALSMTARWIEWDLPLAAEPLPTGHVRYTAHLPVPALQAAGPVSLSLTYLARSGTPLTKIVSVQVVPGGYDSQEINLPPDRGLLLAPEIVQAELVTVTQVWAKADTPLHARGPFLRPIAEQYATTSPYGIRRSYDGGPYDTYHAGQDFGAPPGITVTVPAPGIVALAEPLTVRGNAVIIDHGQGVFTGYWHLSEIFVQAGQPVAAGDLLGLVGNTGLSTGAHLHWELRIYGMAVDPLQFLTEGLVPEP